MIAIRFKPERTPGALLLQGAGGSFFFFIPAQDGGRPALRRSRRGLHQRLVQRNDVLLGGVLGVAGAAGVVHSALGQEIDVLLL